MGEYMKFNSLLDVYLLREKAIDEMETQFLMSEKDERNPVKCCLLKIYMKNIEDKNYFKFDSHDYCAYPDETMIVLQEGCKF